MAYYYYKLVTDNGGAPCVYRGLLSLAICKAQIRATANDEDWIFGFGGKSTIGERLIYIARVTAKIPDGDYYRNAKFKNRPDCIYEWRNNRLRWKDDSRYHAGGEESDIGPPPHSKAAVLLSNDFRYFGSEGTEDYKGSFPIIGDAVASLRRGHRVNHPEGLEIGLTKLRKGIWKRYPGKKIGNPSQSDTTRRCNQTEGSIQCGSC